MFKRCTFRAQRYHYYLQVLYQLGRVVPVVLVLGMFAAVTGVGAWFCLPVLYEEWVWVRYLNYAITAFLVSTADDGGAPARPAAHADAFQRFCTPSTGALTVHPTTPTSAVLQRGVQLYHRYPDAARREAHAGGDRPERRLSRQLALVQPLRLSEGNVVFGTLAIRNRDV